MKRVAEAPWTDRLAALAVEHGLTGEQTEQLREFLTLLAEDPHAPTAVRDPATAVDVHLADSLAGLAALDDALARGAPARVADLGSGAGPPGLVLAVSRPATTFHLIEATGRKCEFLRGAVERLQLRNVEVRCMRAEELPAPDRESYGIVLARAVAPLATLVEYAAPLLGPAGELLAWKGRRDPAEESAGRRAARQVGLELVAVRPVTPYEQSRNRHLHLYRRVRACPGGFPRRPGVARRTPLA